MTFDVALEYDGALAIMLQGPSGGQSGPQSMLKAQGSRF